MTQRVPAGQGLSALQRNILEHIMTALSDQVRQGKKSDRVRWQPVQIYETGASRAAVSNSLRRLEERGLIVRKDADGQRIGKGKQRTAYVGITNTGLALVMQGARQKGVQAARARVETLDDTFRKLEQIPQGERYEMLKELFLASMSELKLVLRALEIED